MSRTRCRSLACSHRSALFGDAQTTAWLYVFWHTAFPALIGAYALLADTRADQLASTVSTARAIAIAGAIVVLVAASMIGLATAGARVLPTLVVDGNYRRMVTLGVSPFILFVCGAAIAALWKRRVRSVLDVWLFAVLWAWCATSR